MSFDCQLLFDARTSRLTMASCTVGYKRCLKKKHHKSCYVLHSSITRHAHGEQCNNPCMIASLEHDACARPSRAGMYPTARMHTAHGTHQVGGRPTQRGRHLPVETKPNMSLAIACQFSRAGCAGTHTSSHSTPPGKSRRRVIETPRVTETRRLHPKLRIATRTRSRPSSSLC